MSVKALEYAVLRLVDALPDSGADAREVKADVRRALGVTDDADHADRTSQDSRDKVAPKSADKSDDDNTSDSEVDSAGNVVPAGTTNA